MSTRRDRAAVAIAVGIWPDQHRDPGQVAEAYRIADLVLAEVDRIPDVSELVDASSLGTPEAKAARATVSDEQAQKAIDIAKRVRAEFDPDNPPRLFDAEGDVWLQDEDGTFWCFSDPGLTGKTYEWIKARFGIPEPQSEGPADPHPHAPLTDGETATPPTSLPRQAPIAAEREQFAVSATGVVTPESVSPSVLPRPFLLWRERDITGLSGTGIVAWGVEFPDGTAALRWNTEYPATAVWHSVAAITAVHGHGGATVVRWLEVSYE